MRVLITGGAGSLGSSIAKKLFVSKIDFLIIDNFETGTRQNLIGIDKNKILEGNILDKDFMSETFKVFQPTHIINSAASYKDPNDYLKDSQVNINGAILLSELAEKYKVSQIINFQTALCYGKTEKTPIKIDTICKPFTSYGISKYFGEYYLLRGKTKVISLRLSNICTESLAIGPIPTFYNRLLENKPCFISDSLRDFLDFEDFYELLFKILNSSIPIDGIFNVSSGISTHISEIFNFIKNYLGKDEIDAPIKKINDDDVYDSTLDSTETQEYFNWNPKINLDQILIKQMAAYDRKPITNIYSHLKNNDE